MHSTINSTIQSFAQSYSAPLEVTSAIKKASLDTGVDFKYLMNQAKAESSFDPDAKARTSSATGLYQFIESTWLRMVKTHGHKYGLEQEANAITQNSQTGKISVSSPSNRSAILDLRKDPELASAMAAELAAENKAYLQRNVKGMDIGATEMYFAHFLGAHGASEFLNELNAEPLAIASTHFPKAAQANRNVFYDPASGQPRTLQQVYDVFDKKFNHDPDLKSPSHKIDDSDINGLGQISSSNARATSPISGTSSLFGGFSGLNIVAKSQDELYLSALMAMPAPFEIGNNNHQQDPLDNIKKLSNLSNKINSNSIFEIISNIK